MVPLKLLQIFGTFKTSTLSGCRGTPAFGTKTGSIQQGRELRVQFLESDDEPEQGVGRGTVCWIYRCTLEHMAFFRTQVSEINYTAPRSLTHSHLSFLGLESPVHTGTFAWHTGGKLWLWLPTQASLQTCAGSSFFPTPQAFRPGVQALVAGRECPGSDPLGGP